VTFLDGEIGAGADDTRADANRGDTPVDLWMPLKKEEVFRARWPVHHDGSGDQ
jgi:hypothetical protein